MSKNDPIPTSDDAVSEAPEAVAPPAPATPPAPVAAPVTKTRITDVVFGWKAAVAVFVAGLILGGLGGSALTVIGEHDHGDRGGLIIQRDPGGGFGGPFQR
jgi:hypothetical protein